MSESLMGGHSGSPTWSQRALDDLQDRIDTERAEEGDFAALAEKTADPEVIKRAAFVGYILGVGAHKELGDRAADVDSETVAGMLKDVLLEVQDVVLRLTPQDELNQLNDRVVRRGEQPGEANF